ncbi:hypothetical protein ACU82A_00100 [Bacillus cereus]
MRLWTEIKKKGFNQIKTNAYSFMEFGDHMINMEAVLAIESDEQEIDDENKQEKHP